MKIAASLLFALILSVSAFAEKPVCARDTDKQIVLEALPTFSLYSCRTGGGSIWTIHYRNGYMYVHVHDGGGEMFTWKQPFVNSVPTVYSGCDEKRCWTFDQTGITLTDDAVYLSGPFYLTEN